MKARTVNDKHVGRTGLDVVARHVGPVARGEEHDITLRQLADCSESAWRTRAGGGGLELFEWCCVHEASGGWHGCSSSCCWSRSSVTWSVVVVAWGGGAPTSLTSSMSRTCPLRSCSERTRVELTWLATVPHHCDDATAVRLAGCRW